MNWVILLFALTAGHAQLYNTDPTLEPDPNLSHMFNWDFIGPDGLCINHHVRCGCPATPPCRKNSGPAAPPRFGCDFYGMEAMPFLFENNVPNECQAPEPGHGHGPGSGSGSGSSGGGGDLPGAGNGGGQGQGSGSGTGQGDSSDVSFESTARSSSRKSATGSGTRPVEVTPANDSTVAFISFGNQTPDPTPSPSPVPPPPVAPLAPQTATFQAAPLK